MYFASVRSSFILPSHISFSRFAIFFYVIFPDYCIAAVYEWYIIVRLIVQCVVSGCQMKQTPSLVDPSLDNLPCFLPRYRLTSAQVSAPRERFKLMKSLHFWSRLVKGKVLLVNSRYEHTLPLASLVHRACLVPGRFRPCTK